MGTRPTSWTRPTEPTMRAAGCPHTRARSRGAADLYYMHSAVPDLRLRVVDIAAGTLIVREAGGLVLDLAGQDLDLPFDSSARTDLAAVGDRRVWEAIR